MACLGEIDRAEPLGESQESFEEGKGDVDVESDEESWHSFDEDCAPDGSKLPVCRVVKNKEKAKVGVTVMSGERVCSLVAIARF